MLTLAFDTATARVSVAVAQDTTVLAAASAEGARRHGEALSPLIDAVLNDAGVAPGDLSVIGVGVGPGPFTGLRIGLVTARTLGWALGVSVHGVCTLDLLAAEAINSGLTEPFLVATDARRKEVYWATYDGTARVERVDGPHVGAPSSIGWRGPVVGDGALLYPDALPDPRTPASPSAAALCRWIAEGLPTVEPEPLYLRRPDAVAPGPRKQVSEPGRR